MTTTSDTATDEQPRVLSARTRRTYAADWALFTDWCAATDTTSLPADPQTVIEFLTGCPAAAATLRCRVAAIDHHHVGAGYPRLGESVALRAALGRPTGEPFRPTDGNREGLAAALRGLPSHGWTAGMFGRRDRALLVLSELAGVPVQAPRCLDRRRRPYRRRCRDDPVSDGGVDPAPADDVEVCGPCAVVRWLKILDLAVTKSSTKTIARPLKKAPVIDHRSPHVCHTPPVLDVSTNVVPLLPPIDQWGALPLPLQRLSPHSLSRRARDLLAGDLGAHRDLPVDPDPKPETTPPESRSVTSPPRAAYGAVDAAAAWDRRRRDLQDLAGIIDVLTDVERRADELNRRAAELVDEWL